MNHLRTIARLVARVAFALASWTAACGIALAQRSADPPPQEGGSATDYTLAYSIVLLGIVLGMLFVLRTSNRREREGPEQYVSKNLLRED